MEHLKIKTRLTNDKFASVKGECDPRVWRKNKIGKKKNIFVPAHVTFVAACQESGGRRTWEE